jgi:GT2 family glycosyltransferase
VPVPDPASFGAAPPAEGDQAVVDAPAGGDTAVLEGAEATSVTSPSRVLAVLVVHDGEPWLARTLEALSDQTHEGLEVVAVDNASTDGSLALLVSHLGEDRVLVADRDLGFGAAVSMALDARAADDAPYVLLLHDDLALAPSAVGHLAVALDDDPRLAVVGPKLREWDDAGRLQSVGWTVDITGRADSGVDVGELDQGQRDVDRRALYVSTGGMLLRREVFDALGRFDRRYHLFRDDLDLCWRAWLAGHDVEVVPAAVAGHVAAATNYQRLGQTRFLGPRYFAERNTLATLLKNYGALRSLTVLPLFFLVGVAKVLGFVLTRRFSDAWQTVRAWAWNVLHLRETRRLRREVQATRQRGDAEVRELFGRIAPRIRAYVEAIGEWVAGGDVPAVETRAVGAAPPEPQTATSRIVAAVRDRPILITGAVLTAVVLAASVTLLAPGQLRGGELAPWPGTPSVFFGDHAAAWHTAAGLGTDAAPSPAQALLGALQWVLLGSAYLAPRVLVLGSLLLAWIFALRATQRYSPRKLPRVVAATAYVLSPPALAAFTTGQIGPLVVLAALPGLVAAFGTLARRRTLPASAWRASAGAALLGAVAGSFVPAVLPLLALSGLLLLVVALPSAPARWRGPLAARVTLASLGPLLLTLPWSARLLAEDGPLRGATAADPVVSELWRWVLLVPGVEGFPGWIAGAGFLLAGILGLSFGWRRQAPLVASLWLLALVGAATGWWLGRAGAPVWPGLPLLLTSASFAGLLAVAFARGERVLGRHAFGWRQLAAVGTGVAVLVSVSAVAVELVRDAGDAYVRDVASLPQFVTTAATLEDPFRVVVLADVDDRIRFEVVPGAGPTMAANGVPLAAAATAEVERAVTDLVSGRDVRAGATLAQLGIRYVVVPDGGVSERLDEALRAQAGLEPRPVASGRVLSVADALPRAGVVSVEDAEVLTATGSLPADAEVAPLEVTADGRVEGRAPSDGVLLVTELQDGEWSATGDGARLTAFDAPIVAFEVPEAGVSLDVAHVGQGARALALSGQLLALLLVISLALRPPGFARTGVAADDDPEVTA